MAVDPAPPRYSLDRRKTGPANARLHSRLSWSLVRDIRQWASQHPRLSRAQQIRELQVHYPLGYATLMQLLRNETWHDPTYNPSTVDETMFAGIPFALLVLKAYVHAYRR